MGYISNIDYNAGNIIVHTTEKCRNMGYGKAVVSAICKECIKRNVLPVYWVNKDNIASINLAKAVGFNIKYEEIVFATYELPLG